MKKIVILLITTLMLTGCLKYDVKINRNFSVEEEMSFVITEEDIFKGEVLNDTWDIYDYLNERLFYPFSAARDDDKWYISQTIHSKNIDEHMRQSRLFNGGLLANWEKEGDFHKLTGSLNCQRFGMDYLLIIEEINLQQGACDGPIEINIRFQHHILEHNADSYDERSNIYTWVINPGEEEREFSITISESVRWGLVMQDFFTSNYSLIIIIVVVVGLGVLGLYFLRRYNLRKTKITKEPSSFPF